MSKSRRSFETQITNGNVTGIRPHELDRKHLEEVVASLWKGFSGKVKIVLEKDDYTSRTAPQDPES